MFKTPNLFDENLLIGCANVVGC